MIRSATKIHNLFAKTPKQASHSYRKAHEDPRLNNQLSREKNSDILEDPKTPEPPVGEADSGETALRV